MEKLLDITLKNRTILYNYLNTASEENLFEIPEGFRNNIWWNIAHVVVTQQLLVYGLSGLDYTIEEELINKYRKGTSPDKKPSVKEMEKISKYLFSTVEQIKTDYEQDKFENFNEYMTSPKVALQNVDDAIAFCVFHEGIHLGTINALKKALSRND